MNETGFRLERFLLAAFRRAGLRGRVAPLIVVVLLACFGVAQEGEVRSRPLTERDPGSGVYYEIFVRSFQDSTGDGIGDLQGVIARLDYLADLGISGIWLMPIHPSPSYHGYDVTDYYDVHPDYGTLADFRQLVDEAHARGMRIVLDLVANHTSSQHPWFQAARRGEAPYRDYYVWRDENPGWRQPWSGDPIWHRHGDAYYYGIFWGEMPDLDYRNPDVNREMQDITRFWLEEGVDGLRVDAIKHIVESEDGVIENAPENFAWVREYVAFVKSVNPDAFVFGETLAGREQIVPYHTRSNIDMTLNQPLFAAIREAVQRRSASVLETALRSDEDRYPADALRATFIGNHDQVRPLTAMSPLRPDPERLKLAASLLLTTPGTPFLYYGDEIGMPNAPGTADPAKRTPMRWTDADGAGFTSGRPWQPFSTVDEGVSVEAQTGVHDSVLEHHRRMIALRNERAALDVGDIAFLRSSNPGVLAFWREHDSERLLVVANLAAQERPVSLDVPDGTYRDLVTGEALELASGTEFVTPPLTVRVLEPAPRD